MSGFEQNAVSRVAWRWQAAAEPVAPAADVTRRHALVQAGVTAAIAGVFGLLRAPRMALVVAGVGLILLLTGLVAPPAFRALDRSFKAFGRGVGVALTWLLLVPFFFLCFAPGHLLLFLRGMDPMQRRLSPDVKTYWVAYARQKPANYYRKQY